MTEIERHKEETAGEHKSSPEKDKPEGIRDGVCPRRVPGWLRRCVKVVLFAFLALVLFVFGVLVCTVRILSPERLTPIVERAANSALNADVSIRRVELSVKATFPFLKLRADGITVCSREMKALAESEKSLLPAYSDTLLSIGSLEGSINLVRLMAGKIDLRDVTVDSPGLNLVIAGNDINNFNILKTDTAATDTATAGFPCLTISRFQIVNPRPFRYYSAISKDYAQINFKAINLEGNDAPAYLFNFDGNFETPILRAFNLSKFPFSINGTIDWTPERPAEIKLRNFDIWLAFTRSRLSADLSFGQNLVIKSFEYDLDPLPVAVVLPTVPDSLRHDWGISRLRTSGKIAIKAKLTRPYNTGTDVVPYVVADVVIPPCNIDYEGVEIKDFSLDSRIEVNGEDMDLAVMDIRKLTGAVRGGRTDISGTLSNLISDMRFDGSVKSDIDIGRLPYGVRKLAGGHISGHLRADLRGRGAISMCDRNNFHRLDLRGLLALDRFYWVKSDTADMAYVNSAVLKFATNTTYRSGADTADSLFKARVEVDSLIYLQGQYRCEGTDLRFNLGCKNDSHTGDTATVSPIGGRVQASTFDFTVLSDTFDVRVREIDGTATVRRYKDLEKVPQFFLDLRLNRSSVGHKYIKMLLTGARLNTEIHRLPRRDMPPRIKNYVDSMRVAMPDISMDSLYILAIERARAHHRRYPRVHPELTREETEIIDWGTSELLRKLLLNWHLDGRLKASRAGLYTPYFPVRNRIRNLNISFNNDSIYLKNVKYKVGDSDFLISGLVSNLRRSLTSDGYRRKMKINLETFSDSIDIDQLAANIFAGARYSDDHRGDFFSFVDLTEENSGELERRIGSMVENAPESGAPLLIPTNIDARMVMRANNVSYSGIPMKDFRGEVLISGGALNIHDVAASSAIGAINLSALYFARNIKDMHFAFGLSLKNFNIQKFRVIVPPVDSVIPLINDLSGIINAELAAKVRLDEKMDFVLPSLDAALRLSGDSLKFIDDETFRKVGKWLFFKNKNRNMIDHVSADIVIKDNRMTLYPFMFYFDRYKLGIQGTNDLAMNFDYRVSVLKSPIPFKFGVHIYGNPDKYKVRLGGAKFNEKTVPVRDAVADTARVNLVKQITDVFRRGVNNSRFAGLVISSRPEAADIDLGTDTITAADSVAFIREGLIPAPLPTEKESGVSKGAKAKKKRKK